MSETKEEREAKWKAIREKRAADAKAAQEKRAEVAAARKKKRAEDAAARKEKNAKRQAERKKKRAEKRKEKEWEKSLKKAKAEGGRLIAKEKQKEKRAAKEEKAYKKRQALGRISRGIDATCKTEEGYKGICRDAGEKLTNGTYFPNYCKGAGHVKCFVPNRIIEEAKALEKIKVLKNNLDKTNKKLRGFEQTKQFDKFMDKLDRKDRAPTHKGYVPAHARFSNEDPHKATNGKDVTPSIGYVTVQHVPSGRLATFPAFVKSFSDTFSLNWNEEPVYGRMDPLYTYSNTKRNLNLSFVIVAERHYEAAKNMQNLDQLIQNLYPAYESGGGTSATRLAAAPLLKISWGNLINGGGGRGMLVACNNVAIVHNVEAGFFEYGGSSTRKQHIIPKEIDVTLSCNVLHDFNLGFKTNGKALEKGGKKSNSFYNFPYGFETANISGADLKIPPNKRPPEDTDETTELEEKRKNLKDEIAQIKKMRAAEHLRRALKMDF